jgi:pimeloyl-ACP methyl ester carboxylesterase
MKRSHWPSNILFILTLLIITTSLLVNILHVRATARGKLFVLIQGINTSLQNNNPPTDSFGTRNGIAPYLSSRYPGAQFLMYSYNGANSNGYPVPYQCQDTIVNDVQADTSNLVKQLGDYLKDKTNMDVYVIAHSFGGLVAYGYLSYLSSQHIVNGNIPGTTGNRVAGIVTLDTPLGGIPNDLYLARIFLTYSYLKQCPAVAGQAWPSVNQLFALYKTGNLLPHGAYNSIARVLFNTNITNQAISAQAVTQGIQLLSIGNTRDYLFNPAACKVILGHSLAGTDNYLSTQWLSDKGNSSGVYGRYFTEGTPTCESFSTLGINHGFALVQRSVQTALGQLMNNEPLTALPIAPPEL